MGQALHGRDHDVGQQLVPTRGVIVQIEAQNVARQARELFVVQADLGARSQHPTLARDVFRDIDHGGQEDIVETVIGVKPFDPFAERLARGPHEDPRGGGPGMVGDAPGRKGARRRALLDDLVGPLGQGELGQKATDLVDQPAVQGNLVHGVLEQRREVALQGGAHR